MKNKWNLLLSLAFISWTWSCAHSPSTTSELAENPKPWMSLRDIHSLRTPFSLAPLPYAADALEPVIDSETMRIHHGKHHQAYVDGLTHALGEERVDLMTIFRSIRMRPPAVRNHAGGHWNHTFFWSVLSGSPEDHVMPPALESELLATFGSLAKFQEQFEKIGIGQFGSGWAWLIRNDEGKLQIVSTPNQDNPLMEDAPTRGIPIFAVDVWEHAYYLKYQNRRAEYLKNFWKIVNWRQVHAYDREATGGNPARSVASETAPIKKYGPRAIPLSRSGSDSYFRTSPAPDFWALIGFYTRQPNSKMCSATASSWIVNALLSRSTSGSESLLGSDKFLTPESYAKDSGDRSYRRSMLEATYFERKDVGNENLRKLMESSLKRMKVATATTQVLLRPATSIQDFEAALLQNEKSADDFILISYMQGELTGDPEGGGHVAVIGAYNAENRQVLILDPDREWYEPYWSPLESVFQSIKNPKSDFSKPGWIHVIWKSEKPLT